MAKRVLRLTVALAVALCLLAGAGAYAYDVEQAQVRLPLIDAYVYGPDGQAVQVESAFLGSEQLKVEQVAPFADAQQGVYYVFMMDTSSSVPKTYINAAKKAIISLSETKSPQDRLALITFGDTVSVVLKGDESAQQVAAAVDAVVCRDMTTHFYDAMDTLVTLCSDVHELRKVAVVISDGIDDTTVGVTREEASSMLETAGVSVNALCIGSAPKAGVESLGQFSRQTGGDIYLFTPSDIQEKLGQLKAHLGSCTYVRLKSFSSIADGSTVSLIIEDSAQERGTREVSLSYEMPDNTPPQILSAQYMPDSGAIRVTFSEPVKGADQPSAYSFCTKSGKRLALAGAVYIENGEHRTVDVMPVETPSKGEYTLTVSGVTDNTMASNPVPGQALALTLDTGVWSGLPVWGWIVCAVGVALLISGAFVAAAVAKRKRQSEERFEQQTQCFTQDYKQHIKQGDGVAVEVEINDGRNTVTKTQFKLISSLILGRADYCDVVFEDKRISGQHCALEYHDDALYVSDLDSTNGTTVNGVAIAATRRIAVGDIIGIGDTKIKINDIG